MLAKLICLPLGKHLNHTQGRTSASNLRRSVLAAWTCSNKKQDEHSHKPGSVGRLGSEPVLDQPFLQLHRQLPASMMNGCLS